jgi:hypothetical protein
MSAIQALCEFNRRMLTTFSDRCIERLTGRPAGALPASFSKEHLRDNVEKEVAKDCLVIERAAQAIATGTRLGNRAIDDLFERSKEIDRLFLGRVTIPSFTLELRYEQIEEIRKKRYRYLATLTADVLEAAGERQDLADAVHHLYTVDQFHGLIGEILFLYCIEVKMLAGMVRFLAPFNRAMDEFIDDVVEAMEQVRHEIAAGLAANMFPSSRHDTARRPAFPAILA